MIDCFEIRSVLGTGGFGITYGAYDERLERRVAIKEYFPSGLAVRGNDGTTLHLRSQDDGNAYEYGLRRFLEEGRTLAKFREPSIVRVTQFLEANGTAYLVMDYEEGEALSSHLERVVTLDETETRDIVIPILEGLHVMHAKQYLHRDIKPSNIFLREAGPAVLLDFGAARRALEEQSSAMTVMLTPGYAPFEQYSKGDKQGAWSDLYALGATMYHCIVGAAPTPSTDRLTSIYDDEPDPVVQALNIIAPRCSPVFIKTIEWMLQPHSRDRPQDAEAVLNVLSPGRSDDPVDKSDRTLMVSDFLEDVRIPEGAGDTVFMPRDGRASTVCSPDMVVALEETLEEFVGGLAKRVVGPAVPKAANFEELTSFLAGFILTEGAQARFLDKVNKLRRAELEGGLPKRRPFTEDRTGVEPPPTEPSLDLGEDELEKAEKRLAEHIGPIARIIVKKAFMECGTRDAFYDRLAEELTDSAEQDKFLSGID